MLWVLWLAACQSSLPEASPPTPPEIVEKATPQLESPPNTTTAAPVLSDDTQSFEIVESEVREENTLTIWHPWEGEIAAALLGAIGSFQEEFPQVSIEVNFIPSRELRQRFEAVSIDGILPTILIGPTEWGTEFFESGLIQDLSGFYDTEDFTGIPLGILGSVNYKDSLIGLPVIYKEGVVIFRNSTIIEEVPVTFEELVIMAQDAAHGGIVGAYLDCGFLYSGGHLAGLGGRLIDDTGAPRFNEKQGIEWLNLLIRFKEAGPLAFNSDDDLEYFKRGSAGLIIDGTWNIESIVDSIGEEHLAVDPWPESLSGFFRTESMFLTASIGNEQASAGKEFMQYLLSREIQAELGGNEITGPVPVMRLTGDIHPIKTQMQEAFDGGTALPVLPQMEVYWDVMNEAIASVLDGTAAPEEALDRAEAEINSLLAGFQGESGN